MSTENNIVKGVPAFSKYLRIHPNTLRSWMKKDLIKYTQVMRTILFDKTDYRIEKKKGRSKK